MNASHAVCISKRHRVDISTGTQMQQVPLQGAAKDEATQVLQQRVEALERQLADQQQHEEALRQQVADLSQQLEHAQVH